LLANYFLKSLPAKLRLSNSALQRIIDYSWPGNIRELKNVIEQASILNEDGVIKPYHLLSLSDKIMTDTGFDEDMPLDHRLNLMEKRS